MKHARKLGVRGAMLGSLGIGLAATVLLFLVVWLGDRVFGPFLVVLLAAACAYAFLACRFRRFASVVLGSLIISACVTAFIASFDYSLKGPSPSPWAWPTMVGLPVFLATLAAGCSSFRFGFDDHAPARDEIAAVRCLSCGYSRTGLAADICPECGQPWNPGIQE